MNAIKVCMLFAFVCHSVLLNASPAHYAWKASIESRDGELNKLLIGADIIKGLSRSDFGDLVVLDTNGIASPIWVRPMQQISEKIEVPLSVHTFSEYSSAHSKTVTAIEENKSEDSRSSIQTTETVRVAKPSNAYIIEFSDYQMALGIHALRVDWTTDDSSQLLELRVEVSDSLNNWKTLHKRLTLAQAKENGNSQGDWQLIDNIPDSKRYIRLSNANPDLPIQIDGVNGIYEEPTLQTIEWMRQGPLEREAESKTAYRFEMPSGVLPSRMRLMPAGQNQIIKGSIYAGNEKYRNKRTLYPNIQQHNLAPTANIIASPSYAVPKQHYKSWWFDSETELQQSPNLEAGYQRQELLFLANGTPPYSLYWGNYEATVPANLLRDVLSKDQDLNAAFDAKLSNTETSGGVERQIAAAKLPWLTWTLWLLLAVAAIFTARMALGLLREMK